jgi:hypothetical protein
MLDLLQSLLDPLLDFSSTHMTPSRVTLRRGTAHGMQTADRERFATLAIVSVSSAFFSAQHTKPPNCYGIST